jgi:hypothetical protein
VLQLAGHVAWLVLVWWLESTGRAKNLDGGSVLAWVIALLLCGSLLLTGVSLFVNLFYGLRREPRALAVVGFAMSFFVGVLATAVVFLQGLRAMAEVAWRVLGGNCCSGVARLSSAGTAAEIFAGYRAEAVGIDRVKSLGTVKFG